MRRFVLPLAMVLVLTGAFTWWWTRPERVIARRVTGLFQSANVAADSGNITRSLRGSAIEGYLDRNITFSGPDGPADEVDGPQSRDSIVAMYTSLAKYCRRVELEKPEIDDIAIDGDAATVRARIDAVIELPNESFPVDGVQHLTMDWRKVDGKWRLSAAKWRETGR